MVLVLTVRSAADISPVGSVGAAALHRLQVFSYSSAPAVHLPLTRGRLTGRIGGGAWQSVFLLQFWLRKPAVPGKAFSG